MELNEKQTEILNEICGGAFIMQYNDRYTLQDMFAGTNEVVTALNFAVLHEAQLIEAYDKFDDATLYGATESGKEFINNKIEKT